MILSSKKLFLIVIVAGIATSVQTHDECTNGILAGSPYFFTRSQSRNKVLQDVASVQYTNLFDAEPWYGTLDVVLAYEKSFRNHHITNALFAPKGTSTSTVCSIPCPAASFKIQGSSVSGRDPNAWLADYFYLPTDFSSTISFNPHISNTLIFLDYYQDLSPIFCDSYVRIYGPITFTRWDLGFCENVINRGVTGYNQGYFGAQANSASILLDNFSSYALGAMPQGFASSSNVQTSIVANSSYLHPLQYAKLRKESHKKTGFADLRFELGWNFCQAPCYHLGINMQGAAPTGNKPDAFFCFQPIVGNGKHWELGVGLIGHYNLYMNEAETNILSFWFDANVTHLFGTFQQRTFDLRNKPVSRYMLAERMGTPSPSLTFPALTNPPVLGASPTPGPVAAGGAVGLTPTLQFKGEFAPVANLTTTNVKVSIDIQADIVAWFNVIFCDWSVDVGYNFWGTTREKIGLDQRNIDCKNPIALCNTSQINSWALKGDAQVYGFNDIDNVALPLSATESGATITGGTNVLVGAPINSTVSTNAGIDNPLFAQAVFTGVLPPFLKSAVILNPTTIISGTNQIHTSFEPIVLSCNDIDFTRNQGLTHKIFVHVSHDWEYACWIPYLGIGGSAEFSHLKSSSCCQSVPCSACNGSSAGTCLRSAASLWSIWVKGGVAF